jgi:predicted Zn-dependent protease
MVIMPVAMKYQPFSLPGLLAASLLALVMNLWIILPLSAQDSGLPELGEAATRFLDADDEEMIGQRFLRELVAMDNYVTDLELRHYLNRLGRRVGAAANLRGTTLHFNLLQDNELNAFAVPGGYITFHTGLVLTAETESELASVIGHEIAHLSQRHLPRMIANAEASKLPTTAAILASILVGGQVGVAGVTLANATLLSNQLAYSRDFEREADAIGIGLMAESGFDPRGMASFFDKLQRFNIVSAKDVPEFLRTHPLSYTRVAESESRISSYPGVSHRSSAGFHLAKARIQSLYGQRPEDARTVIEDRISRSSGDEAAAWRYGLALVLMREQDFAGAGKLIAEVKKILPDTPQVLAAGAEIERRSGNTAAAIDTYATLLERFPDADYIRHGYLETLLAAGDAAEAKKVIRHRLRRDSDDYELYPLLARANVALGSLAEAHQADAEFHGAMGRYQKAISSLKLALRENDDSSQYITQSVNARIAELERLAAERKLLEDG